MYRKMDKGCMKCGEYKDRHNRYDFGRNRHRRGNSSEVRDMLEKQGYSRIEVLRRYICVQCFDESMEKHKSQELEKKKLRELEKQTEILEEQANFPRYSQSRQEDELVKCERCGERVAKSYYHVKRRYYKDGKSSDSLFGNYDKVRVDPETGICWMCYDYYHTMGQITMLKIWMKKLMEKMDKIEERFIEQENEENE